MFMVQSKCRLYLCSSRMFLARPGGLKLGTLDLSADIFSSWRLWAGAAGRVLSQGTSERDVFLGAALATFIAAAEDKSRQPPAPFIIQEGWISTAEFFLHRLSVKAFFFLFPYTNKHRQVARWQPPLQGSGRNKCILPQWRQREQILSLCIALIPSAAKH